MLYLILYIVNGLLTIIAENMGMLKLMYVSKTLMMPLLAIYFFRQHQKVRKYRFIYLALFFSWWGDIFLMFPRAGETTANAQMLFVSGLVSFLIGHLNYIAHFIGELKNKPKVTILIEKPYMILPFLLYVFLLLRFLFPTLGPMKLPVTIYGIVITCMAMAAFNRKNLVNDTSFRWVFVGAVLFVFSDSCIAVNVFYQHFELARILIMSTYITAQLLIVKGILAAVRE